jgi:hypothetical protein
LPPTGQITTSFPRRKGCNFGAAEYRLCARSFSARETSRAETLEPVILPYERAIIDCMRFAEASPKSRAMGDLLAMKTAHFGATFPLKTLTFLQKVFTIAS